MTTRYTVTVTRPGLGSYQYTVSAESPEEAEEAIRRAIGAPEPPTTEFRVEESTIPNDRPDEEGLGGLSGGMGAFLGDAQERGVVDGQGGIVDPSAVIGGVVSKSIGGGECHESY